MRRCFGGDRDRRDQMDPNGQSGRNSIAKLHFDDARIDVIDAGDLAQDVKSRRHSC